MSEKSREIIKDPATGRIVSAHLSSEEASRMGKRKHKIERQKGAGTLLEELGYGAYEEAPEWAKMAAEKVNRQDSGFVSSMRLLMSKSPNPEPEPNREGTCPHCGFNGNDLPLPAKFAAELMQELRLYEAQQ